MSFEKSRAGQMMQLLDKVGLHVDDLDATLGHPTGEGTTAAIIEEAWLKATNRLRCRNGQFRFFSSMATSTHLIDSKVPTHHQPQTEPNR
jgi:hypothetical protein